MSIYKEKGLFSHDIPTAKVVSSFEIKPPPGFQSAKRECNLPELINKYIFIDYRQHCYSAQNKRESKMPEALWP